MRKKSKKEMKKATLDFAVDHLVEVRFQEGIEWTPNELKKIDIVIRKLASLIKEIKK